MKLLVEIRNWLAKNSKKKRRRFTRRASLKAGRYHWRGILYLQEEGTALAWRLTEQLSPVHRLCLNYLCERALQGGLHANFLFREYPYSSHADLAGINRGIIEASVNYLYLLDDPSLERTAAFWARSGFEESVRNQGLKKWLDSKNAMIKNMAQSDYEEKLKSFEVMRQAISRYTGVANPNRGAWPNFKQRCHAVGEVWEFVYDMEYKALSTWQHGDLSRIVFSPSFAQLDPEQEDRNVFEAYGMLQWAFTLNYFFVRELAIHLQDTAKIEELYRGFSNVLGGSSQIVGEHIGRFQPDKFIRK